jgi:hypothetical protein
MGLRAAVLELSVVSVVVAVAVGVVEFFAAFLGCWWVGWEGAFGVEYSVEVPGLRRKWWRWRWRWRRGIRFCRDAAEEMG